MNSGPRRCGVSGSASSSCTTAARSDLVEAIREHRSAGNGKFGPSEANKVIDNFDNLNNSSTQDLLNFLRSL